MKSWTRFGFAAGVVGALALAGAGVGAFQPLAAAAAEEAKPGGMDVVTFRNGRVVEGEVLSDDGSMIRMRVVVAGISTETTYSKSDILSITKAARPAVVKKDATPADPAARGADAPAAPKGENASAARVVMLNVKGALGFDVSETPIERALDEAATADPDVVVLKLDSKMDERVGFDGLFRAEDIHPVLERAMRGGLRVVFWVKSAQVGAAFLPFVSPEIYFTPDGRMGGIGTLQDFNIGDKRVNEKQISLRLGHAEGVAIAGGYAPELVRAMARADYWLSVRFEGGEPTYRCALTAPDASDTDNGWILLSDDGTGNNKDTIEEEVRGTANDVLNLNADWAQRLKVSKGTAADLDALVFQLGLGSDYVEPEHRGQKILDDWSARVKDARDNLRRLRERYDEMQPRQEEEPESFIARKMSTLKEMRATLATYEEVFDPEGQQRAQIDLTIEQHKIQLQDIAKRKKEQGRR